MEFNPSNILRDYNTSIGNITLLENNPKNFRVIFQFRVKFPFFELFTVKFRKCYIPMRLQKFFDLCNIQAVMIEPGVRVSLLHSKNLLTTGSVRIKSMASFLKTK